MNKFERASRYWKGVMVLLLSSIVAGCGGGGGQDPILGGADTIFRPTVTTVMPAPNTANVAINTKIITAAFTKAMDPATLTSSSFTLSCPIGTAQASAVGYVASGNVATLTLTKNLPANSQCSATVTTGAKDVVGVSLAENFAWTFTTGADPDNTAPTVTGSIHGNGQTNVAINTKVGATFSEVMDPLTLTNTNFTLKETVSGNVVAGSVSYSGVNAVFIPTNNLTSSTRYTVTVKGAPSGVKDVHGNVMASDFVISWTTAAAPDTTAPTVTGTIHSNGAIGVPINTKVGATFSEGMDPLTLTNLNFNLKESVSGNAVVGITSYAGVNALFVPTNNLTPSTRYTVTVKGAPSGVKDLAGNLMASDFVISWTTAAAPDTTAPTVTGTIHSNGAIGVPINTKVGATFSEGMDPLTLTNLNFNLKESVSGNAVVGITSYAGVNALFVPTNNLTPSTRYTVTVKGAPSGVKDLAGNLMASDFVISWTTAAAPDTTAPTVISTINANGATGVPINTQIGATFSEAMDPLTITNLNYTLKEFVSGNVVGGTTSYAGVNAQFIPTNNLTPSTRYTVTVKGAPSGVKDLAGNSMASDFAISWTTAATADTTPPSVILVNPADLAVNVPVNSSVNATFNEAMDPLSINTANFTVAGITGLVAYDAINKIATFTPSSSLANNTLYTATISSHAKDMAGNEMGVNKVWRFTTAAIPVIPPTVNLGSAATYGTFGGSAGMTNQGILTVINGNIGTIATTTSTVTGFHDTEGDIFTETGSNQGNVNGTIYTCTNSVTGPNATGVNAAYCALATQARLDAQSTYLALAAMPSNGVLAGNLAGTTINPGVYTNSSSVLIQGGDLTLDALGDANAIFVFQIGSTLTVGGPGAAFPQSIILAGGAQAKNVFWQIGSFATINAGGGGTMVGTLITQDGVSFSTAGNVVLVTLNGRAVSLGASVTMVNTVINVPAP